MGDVACQAGGDTVDPDERLPELRPELRLFSGAPTIGGAPTWVIHDPVQARYVQIDAAAYHVLARWCPGETAAAFGERLQGEGRIDVGASSIRELIRFLHANFLTVSPPRGGWRYYAGERKRTERSLLSKIIHNYLFFRIPLLKPQRILEASLPFADALASRMVWYTILLLGLAGLYLAQRQWAAFITSLPDLFTLEGMVAMAVALFFVKAAHELGHAYTAVRYKCRVATMGVAVILMMPLLYTDVTDAWRLRDRRLRFRIDSAGVRVEFAIASVALFLWSFLPDGVLRGLAFSLCAVSLVSSLAINLNPFMRFDGYYLLSDVLGIDNLQSRAFALGTWKLREWLFGLGERCPEVMSRGRVNFLVAYAWGTWVYRLFLFIAIALLVYTFAFKILGVILFVIEIVVFIARPVFNEMKVWWQMRDRIRKSRRSAYTLFAVLAIVALSVWPWSTKVAIPAVIGQAELRPIHVERPAKVDTIDIAVGDIVTAGQALAQLNSPDLEHEIRLADTERKLILARLARIGSDAVDREASLVLQQRLEELAERRAGLERQKSDLVVRAPITGRVLEVNPDIHPGRWIHPREQIALIGNPDHLIARGYVAEHDLWRIEPNRPGLFVPDDLHRPAVSVRIATIGIASATILDYPEVTKLHGGAIAASPNSRGELVAEGAHYSVTMVVEDASWGGEVTVRGLALVEGAAESFVARLWRRTLQVVIRESGA
jgi:putative peptide zinc metalloprotease protein